MFDRNSISLVLTALVFFLAATQVMAQVDMPPGFKFGGDFRLRYENTENPGNNGSRNREVVRFRAGLSKDINELFHFGTRVATGSSGDPNTADVTLGNFVDDLEISLDRVYLDLKHKNLFLTGGKFANPFLRTDLVWDGDVNPQGVAGSYTFASADKKTAAKFSAIYSIISELTLEEDSHMQGGQVDFSLRPSSGFGLRLAGGYYNYSIKSLANADAGDTRSNYLNANQSNYLSDFNLLDFIAILNLKGFNEQYPIRVIGEYVKNTGAEVDEDQGYGIDVFVGRSSNRKDWRFRYGYNVTETDAVFAAFSNDNTTIPTNYQQHTVTVDYVVHDNTTLNLTWYLHRRKDVPVGEDNEFISRLRLNTMVKF